MFGRSISFSWLVSKLLIRYIVYKLEKEDKGYAINFLIVTYFQFSHKLSCN
jgi:hypothetical protein